MAPICASKDSGNDVDRARCGAYDVFSFAYKMRTNGRTVFDGF